MDVIQTEQIAKEREQLSEEYAKYRYKASKAYIELLTFVLEKLPELKKKRNSIGKEMAILETCAENPHAKKCYEEYEININKYKGLDKIIDAKTDRVGLSRSIWKAERG